MKRRLIAGALAVALHGLWACSPGRGEVDITDPWIRAAPPTATVLAGYLTISNHGDEPAVVVAVETPLAVRVELHTTVVENDVARMRRLERLEIAPGETVTLAPGGLHLMLLRPERVPAAGERVALRITLADGRSLEIEAEVRAPRGAG